MALRARRSGGNGLDAWPGYVDALSTLLMVFMFVLLVFVLAQAFQSVVLAKRTDQLAGATRDVSLLSQQNTRLNRNLSAGDAARAALMNQLRDLNEQTAHTMAERDKLSALLRDVETAAAAAVVVNTRLGGEVAKQTRRAETAETRARDLDLTVTADKATIDARLTDLARLAEQIRVMTALRDALETQAKTAAAATLTEEQRRRAVELALSDEKKLSDTVKARIAALTQQLDQARRERAATEQQRADQESRAAGLTAQLNSALAAQVEELRRYRSEFFGKLRAVLAGRPGVSVVGDRFVFQSEVLFPVSSAEMTAAGNTQMADLAAAFRKIIDEIPAEVNWVLRVDGHTDAVPVHNARFPSNWELSAARAITVVRFLIANGIPATHLAATGFGENQPVDTADTPEAYGKNRRIEIRLTDR